MSKTASTLIGKRVMIMKEDSLYYGYEGKVIDADEHDVWVEVRLVLGRKDTKVWRYSTREVREITP